MNIRSTLSICPVSGCFPVKSLKSSAGSANPTRTPRAILESWVCDQAAGARKKPSASATSLIPVPPYVFFIAVLPFVLISLLGAVKPAPAGMMPGAPDTGQPRGVVLRRAGSPFPAAAPCHPLDTIVSSRRRPPGDPALLHQPPHPASRRGRPRRPRHRHRRRANRRAVWLTKPHNLRDRTTRPAILRIHRYSESRQDTPRIGSDRLIYPLSTYGIWR